LKGMLAMPGGENKKLYTIIIPAYNEEKAIGQVLEQIIDACSHLVEEIILVDDGSSDRTAEIAGQYDIRVIRQPRNMGYGAALKTGIRAADSDYVITMDADGQHRVEDIIALINAAEDNDMVVGQRSQVFHSSFWRMPGKWLLGLMANYILRRRVPDLNSGLRIIRRDVALKYIHICPAGFSFSTTITMALSSRGYRVKYVPITINSRIGKSTVSLATGFNTIILILRIASLFEPLRIFIPLSLIIGLAGIIWAIPYAVSGHGLSVGAMMALGTSVNLLVLGLICDQISQLRLERFE
jgi:glycosyltransferase involved in cell wall biosynthesis